MKKNIDRLIDALEANYKKYSNPIKTQLQKMIGQLKTASCYSELNKVLTNVRDLIDQKFLTVPFTEIMEEFNKELTILEDNAEYNTHWQGLQLRFNYALSYTIQAATNDYETAKKKKKKTEIYSELVKCKEKSKADRETNYLKVFKKMLTTASTSNETKTYIEQYIDFYFQIQVIEHFRSQRPKPTTDRKFATSSHVIIQSRLASSSDEDDAELQSAIKASLHEAQTNNTNYQTITSNENDVLQKDLSLQTEQKKLKQVQQQQIKSTNPKNFLEHQHYQEQLLSHYQEDYSREEWIKQLPNIPHDEIDKNPENTI